MHPLAGAPGSTFDEANRSGISGWTVMVSHKTGHLPGTDSGYRAGILTMEGGIPFRPLDHLVIHPLEYGRHSVSKYE